MTTGPQTIPAVKSTLDEGELIEADALIEEVSIDGMCGVY